MKMETAVVAPCAGVVVAVQRLEAGRHGDARPGRRRRWHRPTATAATAVAPPRAEDTWAPVLDEVERAAGPGRTRASRPAPTIPASSASAAAASSRAASASRCCSTTGSFREVGSLAGFACYDDDGSVAAFTPANHVGGWGTIDGRTVVVCADDFTSRGGHADGAIGAKSFYLDRLSMELQIPSVRLLDGSSGGGSVAAMVPRAEEGGREHAPRRAPAPSRPAGRASPAAAVRSCPATSAAPSTPSSWPPCRSSTCCSAASSASARPRRCSGTSR